MLRTCVICEQEKAHDPTAKRETHEAGFVGFTCIACHRLKTKLAKHGLSILDPDAPDKYAKLKAQRAESKARTARHIPISKPYGDLVLEAQSVLTQFDAEYPDKLGSQPRKDLVYALKRAEHKVQLFGANAFDVKSTMKAKSDND